MQRSLQMTTDAFPISISFRSRSMILFHSRYHAEFSNLFAFRYYSHGAIPIPIPVLYNNEMA